MVIKTREKICLHEQTEQPVALIPDMHGGGGGQGSEIKRRKALIRTEGEELINEDDSHTVVRVKISVY